MLNQTTGTAGVTSLTSGSFTPTQGSLLVVVCGVMSGSGTACTFSGASTTISGQGAFSEQVDAGAELNARRASLAIYTSQTGASPSSGTVTVSFSQSMQRNVLLVYEITGHDSGSPVGAVGQNTGEAAALTATLSGTPAASSLVFAAVCDADDDTPNNIAPGTGFSELNEVNSGGSSLRGNVCVIYDLAGADATVGWSNLFDVCSAGGAIEVKEAPGGGAVGGLSAVLAGATLEAAGSAPALGGFAAVLGGANLSAAGAAPVQGSLSASLEGAALEAAGAALSAAAGQLSAGLAGVALESSGGARAAGNLSSTLAGAALSAAGIALSVTAAPAPAERIGWVEAEARVIWVEVAPRTLWLEAEKRISEVEDGGKL